MTEKLISYLFEQNLRDKVINIIKDTLDIKTPEKITEDNEIVAEACEYTKSLLSRMEEASKEGESELDIIYHLLDVAVSNWVTSILLRKYIEKLHDEFNITPEQDEED